MRRWVLAGLMAAGLMVSPDGTGATKPGAGLFDQPTLLALTIQISQGDEASLRREPRKAVAGRVIAGTNVFQGVAIHLKGGQGSFRTIDEKPALTLNFAKNDSGQRFFGLGKIHLNNSVQDPTYLCEDLAGELFRRAGVAAPRVAWATVDLNGRKLGLFVLKEGFTRDFLEVFFPDADGNLYDGGNSHHEITEPLELDCGRGPRDRSDLQALAAAAQAPATSRWERLQAVLEVQRFASFMAAEVLANHIDGYCAMQNNYRLYFDPGSKRGVFLPHGTDRMFYEPSAPLEPRIKGLVAAAFIDTPEGKAFYRSRLAELASQVFQPAWMTNRMHALVRLLEKTEPLVAREAQALRERIIARAAFATGKLNQQKPNDR